MDILKTLQLNDNNFTINIIGTVEQPLFQTNHIGQLLGLKNIKTIVKDFDKSLKVSKETNTSGGKQTATFLTKKGLYRLLLRSNEPIAYEFQSWVGDIVDAIQLQGKYELSGKTVLESFLLHKQKEVQMHKQLIEAFHRLKVIYVCIIDNYKNFDDQKSIYKIGYSDNIKQSISALEQTLASPITLLHLFECKNKKIEAFIYNDPCITAYKCIENLNFVKETNGLFSLSLDNLNVILEIIKENIDSYNEQAITNEEDNNFEQNEIIPNINTSRVITDHISKKHVRSPWIQKYNPDTFELVDSCESITEYVNKSDGVSYSGIVSAVKKKTIYKGYRWLTVDKSKPNIKYDLEPTEHSVLNKPNELIAMIDVNKTKILHIYQSQKHAAESRHFKSHTPICQAVKNGTISCGHYWKRYDECSDELKATYTDPTPEKIRKAVGAKRVQIIDPSTNEVSQKFDTVKDVLKKFEMSRTKLNQAISNRDIYKNWIFEYVE